MQRVNAKLFCGTKTKTGERKCFQFVSRSIYVTKVCSTIPQQRLHRSDRMSNEFGLRSHICDANIYRTASRGRIVLHCSTHVIASPASRQHIAQNKKALRSIPDNAYSTDSHDDLSGFLDLHGIRQVSSEGKATAHTDLVQAIANTCYSVFDS